MYRKIWRHSTQIFCLSSQMNNDCSPLPCLSTVNRWLNLELALFWYCLINNPVLCLFSYFSSSQCPSFNILPWLFYAFILAFSKYSKRGHGFMTPPRLSFGRRWNSFLRCPSSYFASAYTHFRAKNTCVRSRKKKKSRCHIFPCLLCLAVSAEGYFIWGLLVGLVCLRHLSSGKRQR